MTSSSPDLSCPSCGRRGSPRDAFCASCGMPLVDGEHETLDAPLNEAHGRARKINPIYTEGDLVRVAGGRNQAEAEFIQGLLLEEGVPSVLRRSAGFDVPDFLAAGPRDVMVPLAGAEAARELLLDTGLQSNETTPPARANPLVLIGVISLGGTATALIAWLLLNGA